MVLLAPGLQQVIPCKYRYVMQVALVSMCVNHAQKVKDMSADMNRG